MQEIVRRRIWVNGKVLGTSLAAIVVLYVAIDALCNLDEFLQRSSSTLDLLKNVGQYYLVFVGKQFVGFLGLAAIVTLSILTFRPVFRH